MFSLVGECFIFINFLKSLSFLLIEVRIPSVIQGLTVCLNSLLVSFFAGMYLSVSISVCTSKLFKDLSGSFSTMTWAGDWQCQNDP